MLKIHRNRESDDDSRSSPWVVSGLILELTASIASIYTSDISLTGISLMRWGLYVSGLACFVVGLFYFARSKNRSPLWAVLGVLSLLGWFFVAYLEDQREGEA